MRWESELERLLDALLGQVHELTHLLPGGRLAGGLSLVQLQALAALSGGDLRMRELARRLGLAESTVTRLVDRLERAGLAERRSERPDRRSVLVGLTSTGHLALRAVRDRLGRLLDELLGTLAPGERRELLRLLAKLADPARLRALTPAPA